MKLYKNSFSETISNFYSYLLCDCYAYKKNYSLS